MSGNKRLWWFLGLFVLLTMGLGFGCTGSQGERGPAGPAGTSPEGGGGCTVKDNGDGTKTISCADGTTATVADGKNGLDGGAGTSCTAAETEAGVVLTCGDASVTVQNGQNGQNGNPGLSEGQTPGIKVDLTTSKPANNQYFAAGEKIVVTATITDGSGAPLTLSDLSTASLYMNGPRDVLKDKTAVGLLGASTDRTQQPHHYINLLTNTSSNLVVQGNTITYTLNAITNEDPGTYTVGLFAVVSAYPLDQAFALADVQIGTATVEPLIVGGTNSCADCHKGGANGKLYMHHIIPGHSPEGEPAIDQVPVRTCLMCHNQEGYSAIQVCPDGTKASGGACGDGGAPTYMPDPIVRRVHGVHMGVNLLSKLDTAPGTGDFDNFTGLVFPAGIKDCVKCHTDDSWKTKPSREACGACHDQVDFSTGDFVPPRPTTVACTTDSDCTGTAISQYAQYASPKCDQTTGFCELTKHGGGAQANDNQCSTCHGATGGLAPIPEVHQIAPPDFKYTVDIAMSPPQNSTDYEGSEAPVLTITVKDTSGNVVDPNTFTTANGDTAELFVSGPRLDTKPVLTTAAANPDPNGYYVDNVLTAPATDPKVTLSSTDYTYQLDPVTGLEPGTYTVFFEVGKSGVTPASWAVKNFQVGTATEEPMVATNCTNCHEDSRMHGSYFAVKFNPDICKSCHDYQAQNSNNAAGWGSANSNYGFGAAPLARRVHGVHFGHYLSHPEQVHSASDASQWANIIFPQDVRNCQTCHSESDAWETKPSRVACLACHDSDSDQAHGALMTVDPTPNAPYSGDEVESCPSCHGPGRDFAVDKVHNITNPYVPPYPRDADPSTF